MKRSEVNAIIRDADAFILSHGFHLPPFAYWSPASWKTRGPEAREIVERALGWDITDFGSGDYRRIGLFLFTIRCGDPSALKTGSGKLYAEKLLISDPQQVTPMHFHWKKTEDIINRGGGRLMIKVYQSTGDEGLDEKRPVEVSLDGVQKTVAAGSVLALGPGESITVPQGLYHSFWAADERVLVGEVSLVNDDNKDNRFLVPAGRFPAIEEDEPPLYLLCNEYRKYYR